MADHPEAEGSRPIVAAFDFDGTITKRDSFAPFLTRVAGLTAMAATLSKMTWQAFSPRRGIDRDRAKTVVLASVMAGRSLAEITALADVYATELPNRYQSGTLAHIAHHRAEGHRLVLVSASLALYARPAAMALGFAPDDVLAVELVADVHGNLTGEMSGPNLRGAEKANRLRAHIPAKATLFAYGNSNGDKEMLALADHPTWIGRRAKR